MTFIGNLLPWFLGKLIINQTAASTTFAVGGEQLPAIRATNAFYLISLPTRSRGLAWLLQALTHLLPTGLVLRHRANVDFTVSYGKENNWPLWQVDTSTALVECWTPQRVHEYAITAKGEKAERQKVAARERSAQQIEDTMRRVVAKMLRDKEREAAKRAARSLKSS